MRLVKSGERGSLELVVKVCATRTHLALENLRSNSLWLSVDESEERYLDSAQ